MIRHIVMWRMSAEDAAGRAEQAQQVAELLTALKGVVPEIIDITVAPNVAYEGQNWDVALVADFADLDALARYVVHPSHEEAAKFVRSVAAERAAVDFTL
ncbi:MAG: Dabb family protein [Microbacteriaceae bacterium]|jgi:hypothetical protein|nr:Dabb family protein [Microbacteriaceae bacterium]HOA86185.1 Dabb family protein [Microbacteriaceae bacterium]HPZ33728.1 Dabb family protein [Microbacteriaceae bacterium]HQC92379.1 Dabb family protein [Microbacteriaceae bacterium]